MRFFIVESNGCDLYFRKFKKFKIGKTGILWGYWDEKYRDAIAGRFFDGTKKYEFEVISNCKLKILIVETQKDNKNQKLDKAPSIKIIDKPACNNYENGYFGKYGADNCENCGERKGKHN